MILHKDILCMQPIFRFRIKWWYSQVNFAFFTNPSTFLLQSNFPPSLSTLEPSITKYIFVGLTFIIYSITIAVVSGWLKPIINRIGTLITDKFNL